ncbi:hypothetical protein LPJ64_002700 [Coemansia asiatica]|uniref:Xylanolytic transcriptional activator regulatory domain-containing protein n=1 Tax=Coemansia asiatica TaxID=1052880 RepID=A0A9W8CIW0_9FUNG|nr:hypothetical protein LPJ64_002700 [Coemansia asiatica]
MGFRLAIAMGYHHHDSKLRAGPMQSTADIAHRETCRRAFWGAFLLDRYTAIGGGKALGINDNDISVLLPLRDEDWHSPEIAPPLSALEFFKPVNLRQIKNPDTGMKTDVSLGKGSDSGSSRGCSEDTSASESSSGSPLAKCASLSRNGTPLSPGDGWDSRASETSPLGYFIKLMSVVGQVAQHINTKKSIRPQSSIAKDGSPKSERPSQGYAALDAALLRWKEELPSSLLYSEAKSMDAEPETAVFIACMHAIYHGAVIMLNRENMGLLRDLPGQLDISTNLAIRSLERCRVAAMEVVEITHYICSLPAAMTNALLPWALFQAGTLLIHFMIAGSTPQAQEEARSAILSLDSALRDELSRYWNVSTKYHLILSNMVKAWERTRQVTPNMTPNQQTKSQFQPESSSSISDSAANALQAFNSHMVLPMQMQMQMQLPTAVSSSQGGMVQQQEQAQKQSQPIGQAEAFSTLLKPYSAPVSSSMSSGSDRTQSCAVGMGDISDPQQRQQHTLAAQQSLGGAIDAMARSQGLNSNFLFTPDTAQDSINTLNAFFSQLSQEQARQINEGLQSYYALQGNAGSENMSFVSQSVNGSAMLANPAAVSSAHSQQVATSVCQMQKQQQPRPYVLANPAIQQLQAEGLDSLSQSRLQIRRGSLPISSNGDLFRAPGAPMPPISTSSVSSSGSSFGPSMFLQQAGTSDSTLPPDLDPLLFNPMTPFLQELQMFNSAASIQQQQQQQKQQQSVMPSRSSRNQPSGSFGDSNANSHSF